MKKISIIGALFAAILFGFSATSCQDMLLKDSSRFNYTSANDTLYSYWGILRSVQEIAERQVILNEVRGDLVKGTPYLSDTIGSIANFDNPQNGSNRLLSIADYYAIINNCNAYIANADTNQIKANQKFMLPEYKQVQIIRSWTYLQLVQLYGEVPFILEPITSLSVIDRFDGTVVNKDNIVEKLIMEPDLTRFSDTRYAAYPNIGQYDNGATTIRASQCYFSADIVMGDIYLVGGQYDKAAQSYYDFMQQRPANARNAVNRCFASVSTNGDVSYIGVSYLNRMEDYSGNKEYTITLIPSASNRRFGKVLTSHVNIMGWATNSSLSSSVNANDEVSDNAVISTSFELPMMQITPSDGFYTLSRKQTYQNLASSGVIRIIEGGDARKNGSNNNTTLPIYSYSPLGSSESYNIINKFTSGQNISYSIPVYHKTQLFLRFAEAINRAGHPEYAFAILKDGLNAENLPSLRTTIVQDTVYTESGAVSYDENGNVVLKDRTVYSVIPPSASSGGAYYIDQNALIKAQGISYLNFSGAQWENNNLGIHSAGCGDARGKNDTIYTFDKILKAYELKGNSITTKQDTIDAIENAIVDEMALELSFEGYRFADLVRVATHKTRTGRNGTAWLADKVARRNDDGSNDFLQTLEYQSLYQKLMNTQNWYLHKPATYK